MDFPPKWAHTQVLDYAILVISGADGVQGLQYAVAAVGPVSGTVFIFVNRWTSLERTKLP